MQQSEGKNCRFITFTLCGSGKDKLNDLVDRLYKSFRYLRSHPVWERQLGGAAFLEIKRSSKSDRWHPHLHVISEGKFIPQSDLSDAWRSITHDSYVVDIRPCGGETTKRYVCKYASKPLNSSFADVPAHLDEAIEALKGRRLCLTFGTWYGTSLTGAEDEELADDLTDAHGYHYVGDLETFLVDAKAGDFESNRILRLNEKTRSILDAYMATGP